MKSSIITYIGPYQENTLLGFSSYSILKSLVNKYSSVYSIPLSKNDTFKDSDIIANQKNIIPNNTDVLIENIDVHTMSYSEYDTKRILIPIINDPNLSKINPFYFSQYNSILCYHQRDFDILKNYLPDHHNIYLLNTEQVFDDNVEPFVINEEKLLSHKQYNIEKYPVVYTICSGNTDLNLIEDLVISSYHAMTKHNIYILIGVAGDSNTINRVSEFVNSLIHKFHEELGYPLLYQQYGVTGVQNLKNMLSLHNMGDIYVDLLAAHNKNTINLNVAKKLNKVCIPYDLISTISPSPHAVTSLSENYIPGKILSYLDNYLSTNNIPDIKMHDTIGWEDIL